MNVYPNGQFHDMVEGVNLGQHIQTLINGRFDIGKMESARVASGGVERIREGLHPRFEGGSGQTELDTVEKVYSGPRNPRLGNEANCPERGGFTVQMVDDVVEDLLREEERHRGFHQNGADRRRLPWTHPSLRILPLSRARSSKRVPKSV